MAKLIERGGLNPLIVVSPAEVTEWLRQKADELGMGDRAALSVQVACRDIGEDQDDFIMLCPPELTLMVSNIKNTKMEPKP